MTYDHLQGCSTFSNKDETVSFCSYDNGNLVSPDMMKKKTFAYFFCKSNKYKKSIDLLKFIGGAQGYFDV